MHNKDPKLATTYSFAQIAAASELSLTKFIRSRDKKSARSKGLIRALRSSDNHSQQVL